MRRLFFLNFVYFGVFVFFIVIPFSSVFAVDCIPPVTGFHLDAGVCFPDAATTGLADTPVDSFLMNIMDWLLAIFGFIAIIGFVISGIQYLTSAGDEDTIEIAKRNMKYSVIGVFVVLSALTIIYAIDNVLNGVANF